MIQILNRRKCFCHLVIAGLLTSIALYGYQLYLEDQRFFNPVVGGFNYFAEAEEHSRLGFVVNTSNCRILNISAWDKSLIAVTSSYLKPPVDCRDMKKKWTYVDGQNLMVNTTDLHAWGFKLDDIYCCYKSIQRVEQTLLSYNMDADSQIKYSEDCLPLTGQITKIISDEFVRVLCVGKYFPYAMDVLYRQFHALAVPFKNDRVKRKFEYWNPSQLSLKSTPIHSSHDVNEQSKDISQEVPPNVVIMGIDSMSRLGFRRNMQKTKKALEDIGAVEMFGYTKVGENTFPNSAAFLSGYSVSDLRKICYEDEKPQDPCPYIWKIFDEAQYVTAIVEDAPLIGGFNYLRTGFVQQPVDYYLRPFMLSLYKSGLTFTHILECIGYRTVDEVLSQYISDLIKMTRDKSTPLFLYSWLTNLAHNDVNAARFGDETYANFIRNADLNNTILLFMSDHGYRFGKVRETFAGWYEDKLPNFWLYLPNALKLKYPQWNSSLFANSDRLSSPYDLYKTLEHVLKTFTPSVKIQPSTAQDGLEVPRNFGQSFFNEIPFDRLCEEAGVTSSYCACIIPKMLHSNDSELQQAADTAVHHINNHLPDICSKLSLEKISAGAVLDQNESLNTSYKKEKQYVVGFYTKPGNFLFEATVTQKRNGSYSVDNEILRMNKITPADVNCLSDSVMERFCYCLSNVKNKKV